MPFCLSLESRLQTFTKVDWKQRGGIIYMNKTCSDGVSNPGHIGENQKRKSDLAGNKTLDYNVKFRHPRHHYYTGHVRWDKNKENLCNQRFNSVLFHLFLYSFRKSLVTNFVSHLFESIFSIENCYNYNNRIGV